MTNNTDQTKNAGQQIRRKLLQWGGLASVALFFSGLIRNPLSSKKDVIACAPEIKTVRMLTQDGQLIEVDASKIGNGKKQKITEDQLKTWVNKKQG